MTDFNLQSHHLTWDDATKAERAERIKNAWKELTFGNAFLDDCLGGIKRDDLVVFGAKTGVGKTQIAMQIALANSTLGKRVYYFALEASKYEIFRRLKYQMLQDLFFKDPDRPRIHLNYFNWGRGRYINKMTGIDSLDKYEQQLEISGLVSNLTVIGRELSFTIDTFIKEFEAIKLTADLIIIDHLQYFDSDELNENRAVKDTIKSIRDRALISEVPIVLITHVRKQDRRFAPLLLEAEDFHGSSDIAKIGTVAFSVNLAPMQPDKKYSDTLFKTLKCRDDGSRKDKIAQLSFNLDQHRYDKRYILKKYDYTQKDNPLVDDLDPPYWAENCIRKEPT